MNQIPDFNPNSVSAMPTPTTRLTSGKPSLGGFASALAVARGVSTPSQTEPSEVTSSDKSLTGTAGNPTSLRQSAPGPRNVQSRKSASSDALASLNAAPGNAAGINSAVIASSNPATAVQGPSLQISQPMLSQSSLLPAPAEPVLVQTPDATLGILQRTQTTAFTSTSPGMALDYSALNQIESGQSAMSQNSPRQTEVNQTVSNLAPPSQSAANLALTNQTAASPVVTSQASQNQNPLNQVAMPNRSAATASVPGPAIGSSVFPLSFEKTANTFADPATQNRLTQSVRGTESAEPVPTGMMQASALSETLFLDDAFPGPPGQLGPTAIVPIATQVSHETTSANETGIGQVKQAPPADSPADLVPATTMLGVNASENESAEAGAETEATLSLGANRDVDASSTNAPALDTRTQTKLSAETDILSTLLGIAGGQIPVVSALSLPASAALPRTSQPSPAGQILTAGQTPTVRSETAAIPGVRGADQGAEAPAVPNSSSALTQGALLTSSESANESGMGDQTPFSIFFSGAAPGVESAASILPKMILPATAYALRLSHANGIDLPSASPQTAPLNGGLPTGIRQDLAPPSTKGVSPGTGNGNLQNTQPIRPGSDLSAAAGLPDISPQSAPTPASAPPGTAVLVSVPSAPSAGSVPQTAPPPNLAPAATAIPLPPEPAPLGPVQAAQLVNRLGQSEMRIGLNTSAFGSVEVRTTVRTNDVGLVIGSEKGDLRTLLANDMPAIASTLQQQNLRLNSVNFMQGFAFSNNASGGGDPQQRSFVPTRASADSTPSETTSDDSTEPRLTRAWASGSISILA